MDVEKDLSLTIKNFKALERLEMKKKYQLADAFLLPKNKVKLFFVSFLFLINVLLFNNGKN